MNSIGDLKNLLDAYKKEDRVIEIINTVQKEFNLTHKDIWGEELKVDLELKIWKIRIPIKGTIKRRGLPLPALMEYAEQIKKWNREESKSLKKPRM